MRKEPLYALIMIGLLWALISCQAGTADQETADIAASGSTDAEMTAEPTAADQKGAPPAIEVTATQRPAGDQPSSSGLRARLEMPTSLPLGEPVKVQFFLVNEIDNDLYVLNWFTPLEGLGGDIFRVTRDGQRLRYQGPMASRSDPSPEAYTLVEAGGMVSAEVDLSLAYDFSAPGAYSIEFISPANSHVADTEAEMAQSVDELGPVEMPSNQVVVAIDAG